jgi:hypothetical protein
MMVKTLTREALVAGMYRCQGLGQTRAFEEGEEFTPCSCCCGEITWECWLVDNIGEDDGVGCIIDHTTEVGMISNIVLVKDRPKEGDVLNLGGSKYSLSERYNGLYKVTRQAVLYPPGVPFRKQFMRIIWVERIRDVDLSKPLHMVDLYLITRNTKA